MRLVCLSLVLALGLSVVRINRTASAPVGAYLLVPGSPARGDYVVLCLPDQLARFGLRRGYLRSGVLCAGGLAPVLKQVAALPGDHLELTAEALRVNGVALPGTARRSTDSRNRPIPSLPPGWTAVLPPGSLAVTSPEARSWDSRYYGPLPFSSLVSRAKPLLTSG